MREIGGDCLQLPSAKRELPPTESAHVNDPTEKRSKMETPGDCLQPMSQSRSPVNMEAVDAVRNWYCRDSAPLPRMGLAPFGSVEGDIRRILTHDKGTAAVPTAKQYAAWSRLFPGRSKRMLQTVLSKQRVFLTKKAAELKLPFADAAKQIAAALELAKQKSAAKAEERKQEAAGALQRAWEWEREKELRVSEEGKEEREREQKVRPTLVACVGSCRYVASAQPPSLPSLRS